ncbi:MAG TPA: hypothetical protein VK666_16770, partial [Chryseolinea sp.]|nr:hypothetical protein [Chryseolinea sp.]
MEQIYCKLLNGKGCKYDNQRGRLRHWDVDNAPHVGIADAGAACLDAAGVSFFEVLMTANPYDEV